MDNIRIKENNGNNDNREKIFKNRINILSFLILFLFGIVFFRLYFLQVKSYGFYKEQADNQHFSKSVLESKRGEIFLSEGSGLVPVATNKDMFTAYAIPSIIEDSEVEILAYKISEILGLEKIVFIPS